VTRLYLEELGDPDAPVIALLHGSMDRCSGFRAAARLLAVDHCVLLYDRRGYGRSVDLGPPFGVDQHVADLVGLLRGRRAAVVGHSYGGVVALAAAQGHAGLVRSVGAYESPMAWTPWWPSDTAGGIAVAAASEGGPEAAAERFLQRMLGDRWDDLPAATRRARQAEGPALLGEMEDLRLREPYAFAAVGVPVVAGRGERSAVHHRRAAAVLAESVPDGELIELAGVRHDAHHADPASYAAFARRVVARATAAGR
jgi:pimeloyl-ACP methyl ester carboxylesterase